MRDVVSFEVVGEDAFAIVGTIDVEKLAIVGVNDDVTFITEGIRDVSFDALAIVGTRDCSPIL
jgi:hypothetical protein